MKIEQRIAHEIAKSVSWEEIGKGLRQDYDRHHPQLPETRHFVPLTDLKAAINNDNRGSK